MSVLHLLGTAGEGGAETYFLDLVAALADDGVGQVAAIRANANREAALARKLTIDKGLQIGLDGVQLLGGHGFTKEHPVERWYRDLRGAGIGEGIVVL